MAGSQHKCELCGKPATVSKRIVGSLSSDYKNAKITAKDVWYCGECIKKVYPEKKNPGDCK